MLKGLPSFPLFAQYAIYCKVRQIRQNGPLQPTRCADRGHPVHAGTCLVYQLIHPDSGASFSSRSKPEKDVVDSVK